jgi:hypothetical protein
LDLSRILQLFGRRTEEAGKLLPELCLHGLAIGECELALRGMPGDGAAAVGRVDGLVSFGLHAE